MKLIKLIIALLICSTSFGQITNITGDKPKIRTALITPTSDTLLVIIGDDIYKMAIADLPAGGGGGSGGGNVYKSGTPTANQVALWVNDSTIKGIDTATLFAGLRANELALLAPKASPTFTGTLTAAAATFSGNVTLSGASTNRILYTNASGVVTTNSNFYFIESNPSFIFNMGTLTGAGVIFRRGTTSNYSHLILENTSGVATDGYMDFGDAGSSGYYPRIIMAADNTTATFSMLEGRVRDASGVEGIRFSARNQAGSAALANSGAKAFTWYNYTTELMSLGIDGNVKIVYTPTYSSGGYSLMVKNTTSNRVETLNMNLTESTYTPTLFNTTNIAASTAYTTYYQRVGDVIHVWGTVDIDATSASTISEMGMELPVASGVGQIYNVAGTGSFEDNTTVQIKGDVANGRAMFRFTPQTDTNNKYSFHFTYKYVAP